MNKILSLSLSFLIVPHIWASDLHLEIGVVENSYNQVKVPGDDGTRFNLRSGLDDGDLYYRLQLSHLFNDKHGVRLLYAPLKLTGDKVFSKDVKFDGSTLSSDTKTDNLYKFNSYRATYFYQLVDDEKFKLRTGLTAKVRDAQIRLKQRGVKESRKDVGVVPLLYLYSEYYFTEKFFAALDFDGLVGPSGRAFDVALMGSYKLSPSWQWQLGARMLEGGVDNDKVYNFSQFNYYFTGLKFSF